METVGLEEERVKQTKEELQSARAQLKPIDNRLDNIKQHITKIEEKLSKLVKFIFIFKYEFFRNQRNFLIAEKLMN